MINMNIVPKVELSIDKQFKKALHTNTSMVHIFISIGSLFKPFKSHFLHRMTWLKIDDDHDMLE